MAKEYVNHWYEDTNIWKIFQLDVWETPDGSWHVNDFYELEQIEIAPIIINKDYRLIDFLEEREYLTLEQRDTTYVDSDYGWIYIRDLDTDRPILGLEMVRIYHRR